MIRTLAWGMAAGLIEYLLQSYLIRRRFRRERECSNPLHRASAVPVAAARQAIAVWAAVGVGVLFVVLGYLDASSWVAIPLLVGYCVGIAFWEQRRVREIDS